MVCFKVYSWGDNEHGQLGDNSTTSNRKPQIVSTLKGKNIAKIACGSSHSIAFCQGIPVTSINFSPVSFTNSNDPLGSSLLHGKLTEPIETEDKERPTLTQIILSLNYHSKRQEALGHVLTSLQILYARDTIVNALSGIVTPTLQSKRQESQISSIEFTTELQAESIFQRENMYDEKQHESTSLNEFISLLTVEDSRVLVDLLKLAVSGRVGDKGKSTLSVIVNAMGNAYPEVCQKIYFYNIIYCL